MWEVVVVLYVKQPVEVESTEAKQMIRGWDEKMDV